MPAPEVSPEERAQAEQLERELFGGAEELVNAIEAQDAPATADDSAPVNTTYVRDAYVYARLLQDSSAAQPAAQELRKSTAPAPNKKRAVWVDDDDAQLTIDLASVSKLRKLRAEEGEAAVDGATLEQRLRGQHKKLHGSAAWATLDRPEGTNGDVEPAVRDELQLQQFEQRLTALQDRTATLPPGRIELTRVQDANVNARCQGVVQALEFHPSGRLLMSASLDKRLRFFTVDGVRNPLVQSLYLQDLPVRAVRFVDGGAALLAAGRRRFFYSIDLAHEKVERINRLQGKSDMSFEQFAVPPAAVAGPADQRACAAFLGNEGAIPLVSLRSRQLVGELRMSGSVRAAAFSPDGQRLFAAGGDGRVHVWDMRMRRCVHRFADEGCVQSTCLAASASHLAAGSRSGVVNVYGTDSWPGSRCEGVMAPVDAAENTAVRMPQASAAGVPEKDLGTLVTPVDTLTFSPDAQILCMASRLKKDALRLVHTPSLTVFANWPTSRSPLHYVHCAAFSPGGGFLAVGNAKGHVLTYRLHHYSVV